MGCDGLCPPSPRTGIPKVLMVALDEPRRRCNLTASEGRGIYWQQVRPQEAMAQGRVGHVQACCTSCAPGL